MAWGITAQKVIDQSGASAAFSSSSGTVTGATTGQYAVLFLTGRKNNNTDVPNASLTVTLGGSAMSFQQQSNATSVAEWAAIYVLPVPSSGDLTLSVSGVSFRALEAHVFLLTGHNTGAPVVVSDGVRTTSNITTQSFTRTTAANGNLLLSSICIRSVGDVTSTLSLVNGGTLEINDATGNNTTYDITSASASEIVATAAADGHGYSWTGSTRSCLVWIEMAVDAGTSALTFPGAGSVTAQGLAPTVAAGVGIAAGVGSVAVQGLQPVIGISVARTTGKGAVSVQGLAPAVLSIPASEATWVGVDAYWVGEPVRWSLDAAVAAGKGAVTVQGHAPVVAAGSVRLTGLGAVSAQGLAPTVSVSSNVAAGAGAVAVAGSPPTVLTASGVIVTAGIGALAVQGLAPAVASGVSVLCQTAAVVVQGLAPVVTAGAEASAGAGAVTAQGLDPEVFAGTSFDALAGVGSVNVIGLAPVVSAQQNVTLDFGTGSVTITGMPPTVWVGRGVALGLGMVTVRGYEPFILTRQSSRRVARAGNSRNGLKLRG